jgi:fructose-bisphosphate aldolase class I
MTSTLTSAMDATIASLLCPGKGILAADESFVTIGSRFAALDIVSTAASRRAYREMLFTTPALAESVSGAILFDETMGQRTAQGALMPEALEARGIAPGIKVDRGTTPLVAFAGELVTSGLDGLRERLVEYRDRGARFTKWRAVMALRDDRLSRHCIEVNVRALAMFAALSQEAGLVPIVEPELLMDGRHTIEQCGTVVSAILVSLFAAMFEHRVVLEDTLLKTGMIVSGSECPERADAALVADATIRCLRRSVPAAVPGILFLSGGQDAQHATARLAAICGVGGVPWTLSFSFGRALQSPALAIWKGLAANVAAAQAALLDRAQHNSAALQGRLLSDVETSGH